MSTMSKRGWIIVSVIAGSLAGLAGTAAGFAAYIHRARKSATTTAREAFDPYYAMVEYLRAVEGTDPEWDGV